jgi:hypothetical protein
MNGHSKWLLGVVATVVLGAAGWAVSDVRERVARVETLSKDVAILQVERQHDRAQLAELKAYLERIDRKIDRILEKSR